MLVEQNGVCAICRQPESRTWHGVKKQTDLAVDHCHETKRVRGLLCHKCNSILGYVKDSPVVLRTAADYLERHSA